MWNTVSFIVLKLLSVISLPFCCRFDDCPYEALWIFMTSFWYRLQFWRSLINSIRPGDIASWNLSNIGAGNGLLPTGIKPLSEPMLPYCQLDHEENCNQYTIGSIHENAFQNVVSKMVAILSQFCNRRRESRDTLCHVNLLSSFWMF